MSEYLKFCQLRDDVRHLQYEVRDKIDDLQDQIQELTRQRDILKAACEEVVINNYLYKAEKVCKQALEQIKQGE